MKICDICLKMKPDTRSFPSKHEGGQPIVVCTECTVPDEPCPGCDTPQLGHRRRTLYMPSLALVCPACQEREHVTMYVRKEALIRPGGPRMGHPG